LLLLDSRAPNDEKEPCKASREEVLLELVALYEMGYDCALDISAELLDRYDQRQQLALLLTRLVSCGILPAQTQPQVIEGVVRLFEANFNTKYVPGSINDGKLELVYAADSMNPAVSPVEHATVRASAWARHSKEIRSVLLPGNHMTLLRAPHVADLGRHIEALYWAHQDRQPRHQ